MFLSICIPTYNRKDKLLYTLQFIVDELCSIDDSGLELIVGDNCSTDGTYEAVSSFLKGYSYARIIRNSENLGLVGNVINLSTKASGKYVWFLGDDDVYYKGIVKEVLIRLKRDNPSLLFINHKAYFAEKKESSGFNTAVDLLKPEIYIDGCNAIVDIWGKSETSLMFISCIVYNRDDLTKAISLEKSFNLASPLYYSFYVGSRGGVSIIKKVFIENIWDNTSWSSKSNIVFFRYVPKILLSLNRWGYKREDQTRIVRMYFGAHKRAILGCLFRSLFRR